MMSIRYDWDKGSNAWVLHDDGIRKPCFDTAQPESANTVLGDEAWRQKPNNGTNFPKARFHRNVP